MFSISIVLFGCSQDKEVKQSTLLSEKTYQVQEIEGIENFIIYAMDSREKTLYLLGTSKAVSYTHLTLPTIYSV